MFLNGDCFKKKSYRITSKGKKIMSDNQIKNFIMFYERLNKTYVKNLGSQRLSTVITN